MKIIAVSNIKGGVGKTTTAVNLAFLCALSGRATLLWDLDPQGAATYVLRCDHDSRPSAKKLVRGIQELPELVVHSGHANLDVIPASRSYRHFDRHLAERKRPIERLLKMSRPIRGLYDVLLLDCPPGISLLSENILHAADAVVVPMIPSPLSVRMLSELQDFVTANGWTDLKVLPFFSMVDRRRALHGEVIDGLRKRLPALLRTEVCYWSEIERMTVQRAPLPAYAPRSASARVYAELWHEIETRVGLPFAPPGIDREPPADGEAARDVAIGLNSSP